MKIKRDENLPDELADLLAASHHDVHTFRGESLVGCDDRTGFAAAVREQRALITQDLDFADVRQFKPGTHPRRRPRPAARSEPPTTDPNAFVKLFKRRSSSLGAVASSSSAIESFGSDARDRRDR